MVDCTSIDDWTGPHGVRRGQPLSNPELSEGVEYGNRPGCKMTIDENIVREHEPFSVA